MMKKRMLWLSGCVIVFMAMFPFAAGAATIFSDHFDSTPDWSMSQSGAPQGWSGKLGQNRGGNYDVGYINATGRHGSSGKGFIQYWDKTTGYSYAQDSWLMKSNINIPGEFYLGYWFQHDPSWDWGSVSSLKIMKIHFNDNTTWDIYWTNFCAGCTDWRVPAGTGFSICTDEYGKNWYGSWNALGSNWHYFIWHVNHATGLLELTIDGVSVAKTSYATSFKGTGFDSVYGVNFGGNITNGGGGVNEMWTKYDDIIMATTRAEVESFLGIGSTPVQDTTPPAKPTGTSVKIVNP